MTTDAGSGFDNQAAGRDVIADDADDEALEEARERQQVEDQINDAF